MAFERNPDDPTRPMPGSDERLRSASQFDGDLQPDPELAEGRAGGGRIALFAIAIVVIMLAGLQTVPKQLIEAARSDGANSRQILWNVTLPMMSPTIFFAAVITFIGAFQIFDPIQIITPDGGPDNSTISIVMYLYRQGFNAFQVGYASAVSLLVFAGGAQFAAVELWTYPVPVAALVSCMRRVMSLIAAAVSSAARRMSATCCVISSVARAAASSPS